MDKIYYSNQFPHLKLEREEISFRNGFKHVARLIELYRGPFKDSQIPVPAINRKVLILVQTENQRNALIPLVKRFGNEVQLLDLRAESSETKPTQEQLQYLALLHSWNMLLSFFTVRGNDRIIYRKRFYNLHTVLGYYEYAKKLITQKNTPLKLVIASNDHSGISISVFLACNSCKLESLYVQHASVNQGVTPLIMTYAFLDGKDAQDKYHNAGSSNTKISLTGIMKLDPYLALPAIKELGKYVSVGISTYFCDIDKNFNLCQELESRNIPFIVRFHPNVPPHIREKFAAHSWKISDNRETALDHILNTKAVISGDSTILLEAIMLYRRPVYFASEGVVNDFYHYLKNGLIDKAYTDIEELVNGLEQDFDMNLHRKKAKYYNDALYSDYEGQSVERTAELILKIMVEK
ncbi:hypothetical protein G3O08_07975 [Cryomorpha ignava]|uniref:CDP-glycerol glycerophosphotransferase family protein n=1 Tax=Cryomorpha ignava TaxID=101383 RepID=A0A7K3WPH2_9FLAO|nr:hypothetical protein [Cryomorpha ignava]NEN23436.1 hypothetical protein [Cryomorpha ignava]